MKIGDLVKENYRYRRATGQRFGIIVGEVDFINRSFGLNREFKVLWSCGTLSGQVGSYDLRVINESR